MMRFWVTIFSLLLLAACSDSDQDGKNAQQASTKQEQRDESRSQSKPDKGDTSNKTLSDKSDLDTSKSDSSSSELASSSGTSEPYRPKAITFNKSQPKKTKRTPSFSLKFVQRTAAQNNIDHKKLPDFSQYNFGAERWLGKEPTCYDESDLRLQKIVGIYIRNTEMGLERTYGSEVFYFDGMTDERLNLFQHEQVRKRNNNEEGESKIFDCRFVGDDHFAYAAVSGNYLIVYNLNNGQRIGSYHFKDGLDDALLSTSSSSGTTTINVLSENATYRFKLNG